jgi:hypothetical protein
MVQTTLPVKQARLSATVHSVQLFPPARWSRMYSMAASAEALQLRPRPLSRLLRLLPPRLQLLRLLPSTAERVK